jgi:hypothetical protein
MDCGRLVLQWKMAPADWRMETRTEEVEEGGLDRKEV